MKTDVSAFIGRSLIVTGNHSVLVAFVSNNKVNINFKYILKQKCK